MGWTTTPLYSFDCANASLAVANSFSGPVSDSSWRVCFATLFLAIDTWAFSGSHRPLTVVIFLTWGADPALGFSIVCCASVSDCWAPLSSWTFATTSVVVGPLSRTCCAGAVAVEEKRCGRWGPTKCSHRAIVGVKRLWARHIRCARECCIGRQAAGAVGDSKGTIAVGVQWVGELKNDMHNC